MVARMESQNSLIRLLLMDDWSIMKFEEYKIKFNNFKLIKLLELKLK
jgi:hypothetical protein